MSSSLTIRMYNVGFGDCFLIRLPEDHVLLVDAGFHSQGRGMFEANELVQQIIDDVTEIKGEPHIDIVVATHRHADHIFAFNSELWEQVTVGEVWLPWVEDPSNPQATKLWKKQTQFAAQLAMALDSFGLDDEDRASVEFMLWNAGVAMPNVAPLAGAAGNWSNLRAMKTLHSGFASRKRAKPRFLPKTETFPETFETSVLPDVKVHVLGPPRDAELIEELDPEKDGETYRALALRAGSIGDTPVAPPFATAWLVSEAEDGFRLGPDEVERLQDLATSADAVFAATKVDGMINSTSLVLVLEIGSARLLLPGDAEWGTWRRILENQDACDLIGGATFFKVGHHGSHNATSKTLVEKVLPRRIPAMISTLQGPGKYRNNIPLTELMEALDGHGMHCARSDEHDEPLVEDFTREESNRWIDLTLDC